LSNLRLEFVRQKLVFGRKLQQRACLVDRARGGLDGVFTPPAEEEKQSNPVRRPQTGHGRKQSTSSGAKRK
jgi:hypothetical protein